MSKKLKINSINWMYFPALMLFLLFIFYPLLLGFKISFTNWDGYHAKYGYVFLDNYKELFHDTYFLLSLRNTIIFGIGTTIFHQIFGLILALILDSNLKGVQQIRVIIYLPMLISPIIMGIMYYMILQYDGGPLNDILVHVFHMRPITWLSKRYLGIFWIITINTLQFIGISVILYLIGLQSIWKSYYEVAKLEGASPWDQFRYITLPLLYPAITTSLTLNLIGGLKLFDVIKVLTNGGPGYSTHSLSTYIGFVYQSDEKAGYASAIGIFLFIMIMLIVIIMHYYFNKKRVEL